MPPNIIAAPGARLPAAANAITIGSAVQSRGDIQDAARAEISRQLAVIRRRAAEAATPEMREKLHGKVPLELTEYLEAVRNYNSWSSKGDYDYLPNDCPALRAFLSKRLPRDRFTPDAAGWQNYLADRYGMHFPEPAATPIMLPEWTRRYHTLVAGTTGAGKSELLKALAHHYIRHDGAAVVVLDPHGSLARQIAHFEEFQGPAAKRLVYVAYEGELGRCPIMNPFDVRGLPRSALDEYAADFAKVLGDTIPQGFTQPMLDLIRACCRVLLDHRPNGEPATLLDLHRFVSPYPDDAADLVTAGKRHPDPIVAAYFRADFAAVNIRPTKEGLRSRLSNLLLYNSFRHMTCGRSTIDLTKAADDGGVILFDLSTMGRLGGDTFGKLVVAQLVAHAMRRPEGAEQTHTPIHLFIDEAQRLFTGTFLELLEQTRKKALYLTFAQQVAGKGFSGQDLESLLINTNIKLQGPGGCPPRMLDALGITVAEYRQLFPDVALNEQIAGGDFICKWGNRTPAIFFRVTRDIARNRVGNPQFAQLIEHQHLAYYERTDRAASFIEGADIPPAADIDTEESAWPLR